MKTIKKKNRILELDFLRGLAIIGMIAFHFYYFLDFYGLQSHNMSGGFWYLIGQFVRFGFLLLVGISTTFSNNNIKRALIILVCAMIVTGASYFAYPDFYIRFGILHLIGISIILISPLKKFPRLALIFGIIAIFMPIILLQYASSLLLLIIIGFSPLNFTSFDLFPIFPWIGIPLIGIFFANKLYKNKKPLLPAKIFSKKIPSFICTFGQNALTIYMIHLPIILFFIFFALKTKDLN
jgi:uncharacterized membrane protein